MNEKLTATEASMLVSGSWGEKMKGRMKETCWFRLVSTSASVVSVFLRVRLMTASRGHTLPPCLLCLRP